MFLLFMPTAQFSITILGGTLDPHGLGLRALDPKPKTRNSRAEPGFKGLLKGISRVL